MPRVPSWPPYLAHVLHIDRIYICSIVHRGSVSAVPRAQLLDLSLRASEAGPEAADTLIGSRHPEDNPMSVLSIGLQAVSSVAQGPVVVRKTSSDFQLRPELQLRAERLHLVLQTNTPFQDFNEVLVVELSHVDNGNEFVVLCTQHNLSSAIPNPPHPVQLPALCPSPGLRKVASDGAAETP
ncbi:hypothetical protein BDV96DRAFT_607274 [Lophiotrema nucula]|uniref:Uncharacterized protein n=1 Tax=Lophiotrema nucula TaxID=690887 RepID=A0A6A5YIN3_9PLEO|nr:hypothetical protein BDV96DRAFT_607274 [Lophiotrema nucula]